ncbi:hypothetical protein KSS87_020573 [Heliosperma pusillum]|nr:hypothetical protein KSS87_020573 [Heliosperma pusillum]
MGGAPSTPQKPSHSLDDSDESLITAFVGEKTIPLTSEFWQKLLDVPLDQHQWPPHRVLQACESLVQNNQYTRHLVKLLIHFACCLQDCTSVSDVSSIAFAKALNATYLSSVFLKYAIENSQTDNFEDLYLALDDNEVVPSGFSKDQSVENFVIHSVLNFICKVEASPHSYRLQYELLNFMMVAMSTQLLSEPSPRPKDVHPFTNAVMVQEASLVAMVVHRLLLNYISQPQSSVNVSSYSGVLQKVGSTAANLVLMPLNLFVGSNNEASRGFLGQSSLHMLLVLVYFRKCVDDDGKKEDIAASDDLPEKKTYFSENPYCKALDNAINVEFDREDVERNARSFPLVRVPFASLYDTLGMSLSDEAAGLLLYSLVQGNANFLEYVLVRTDIDTLVGCGMVEDEHWVVGRVVTGPSTMLLGLSKDTRSCRGVVVADIRGVGSGLELMPVLEILYNAPKKTSNQIYMLLIILLILSQDSTFNASIHKLMLPDVPWYQERRLHHTSLGSLMIVVLIRTVKYNLSRLQDIYLHTNCLATLANMAPHVHCLNSYASQRLVSLFHMLSRKYNKLEEIQNNKMHVNKVSSMYGEGILEDVSVELHIYTDFLRIVLEIINAILSYALPRNPEVVYAVLHRQEVFHPFRNHPRFTELLENIFNVLDFFEIRMDAHEEDGEWSVEKVLQVIINNCRSWRADGMKMFTQLRFTYEQESHPEEFFIPYVWQLVVSNGEFAFNSNKVKLFSGDQLAESKHIEEQNLEHQNGSASAREIELDL